MEPRSENSQPQEPPAESKRLAYLRGIKRWSGTVAGLALGLYEAPSAMAGWVNSRGGWINGGGGGWANRGGSWINGSGGGWVNRGGATWVNGGGGWINSRGGWLNAR